MLGAQLPMLPGPVSTAPPAPPAPPVPHAPSLIPERVYDDSFQYDMFTIYTLPFAQGLAVEIINRRVQGGNWVPFLMVAPSAVLQSNGHSGSGLFSLISYAADSEARIGASTLLTMQDTAAFLCTPHVSCVEKSSLVATHKAVSEPYLQITIAPQACSS